MSDTFVFPPLDERTTVVTDVLTDGCTLNDVKNTVARIAEMTAGPLDLVLVAVPAGEGVAVEMAVQRALRVEPDRSVRPADLQRPQRDVDGSLEESE